MLPFNTFTIHTLLGAAAMACLAVIFLVMYRGGSRHVLHLLLSGIAGCVAMVCLSAFMGNNLVRAGTSAYLTATGLNGPSLSRIALVLAELQWISGVLTLPLLVHFAGRYCRANNFIARRIWLVYAGTAGLVLLIGSGVMFRLRAEPIAGTSSWSATNPWRPLLRPWVLAAQVPWVVGLTYCLFLLVRHCRRPASAPGDVRSHPRLVTLAVATLMFVVVADFVRSGFRVLPGPGLIPFGACVMALFLAVALSRDHAENTRLRRQAEARTGAILEQAREEERRRLAADLHDSLAQQVLSIQLLLKGAMQSQDSRVETTTAADRCAQVIREIRRVCHNLYPPALASLGLVAALRKLLDEFGSAERRVELFCDRDIESLRLPQPVETGLFRMAQEAMSNAVRHGQATRIDVSLSRGDGELVLSVTDNGRGFDPSGIGAKSGLGLEAAQARAKALQGRVEIHSEPGSTIFSAVVPFPSGTSADPGQA